MVIKSMHAQLRYS